jgi:hypothetical protein
MAQSQEGYVHCVDIGAMINGKCFDRLEAMINEAQTDGAQVFEGQRYVHAYHDHGYYFRPSIVANVREDMEIANEEGNSFLFSAAFRDCGVDLVHSVCAYRTSDEI